MKKNIFSGIFMAAFFYSMTISAMSDEGKVTIKSPKEMSVAKAREKVMVEYETDPGKNGDHLHLLLNNKQQSIIRNLKGSVEVGPLDPGKNKICLVLNTKGHSPTGAEGCVNVDAK